MSKCDFCDRPMKYYTAAQAALYCDSPGCVKKASEIELKFLDVLLEDQDEGS